LIKQSDPEGGTRFLQPKSHALAVSDLHLDMDGGLVTMRLKIKLNCPALRQTL